MPFAFGDANSAGGDDWLFFRGLVPESFSSALIPGYHWFRFWIYMRNPC
jgi:hypothetical protein